LYQVIGKRVVIVDHHKHLFLLYLHRDHSRTQSGLLKLAD
jgi:hypothetical protein